MKRNMRVWKDEVITTPQKLPLPILTFPVIQLMGITVQELIGNSETQAQAMKLLAERNASLASVSMMDLSVEAEAFGAQIHVGDNEVPAVIGSLVTTHEEAEQLAVPSVGTARTQIYIDAMRHAVELITDRPVLAGVIGPFSLAGRLIGTAEVMKACKRKPDMVRVVMEKCTDFLIRYMEAYKATGCNGIVMAEPLTGLLSPKMAEEFSEPYVKRIVEAIQCDEFAVIYHNCGNNTMLMTDSLTRVGAIGYHFGNAIQMTDAIRLMPADRLVMGNVDPASFAGRPASAVYEETQNVMRACCQAPNFVISSGCDIAPISKWENIDAFYQAADDFYHQAKQQ